MESWYPIVIGSVIFFYVHFFIRNAKLYLDSGKTLELKDSLAVFLPNTNT